MAVAFFTLLGSGLVAASSAHATATAGAIGIALFVAGAATDALDGWLARRWEATSTFGRVMDPFVDKVLVLGGFIYLAALPADALGPDRLAIDTGISPWMVVVILSRELLVTSLRGWLEGRGLAFGADGWGKLKMLLQSVCIPVCLFVATQPSAHGSDGWQLLRSLVVLATVGVTAISVVPYLQRAFRAGESAR